jgi:hypothetical protein
VERQRENVIDSERDYVGMINREGRDIMQEHENEKDKVRHRYLIDRIRVTEAEREIESF